MPTVVIPGGAESVPFSIGAIDNAEADGTLAVTISANAEGFEPDTRSILLLDDELLLHNGVQPLDVDNDGFVVPLDALLIIHALITTGGVPARDFVAQHSGPTVFLDTTGDDWVSPRDALLVVNALTASASEGGRRPFPSEVSVRFINW